MSTPAPLDWPNLSDDAWHWMIAFASLVSRADYGLDMESCSEVAQEAVSRMWAVRCQGAVHFADAKALSAYLRQVVRSIVICKKKQAEPAADLCFVPARSEQLSFETVEEAQNVLAPLSDQERAILLDLYGHDYRLKEVAERHKLTIAAVFRIKTAALAKLNNQSPEKKQ